MRVVIANGELFESVCVHQTQAVLVHRVVAYIDLDCIVKSCVAVRLLRVISACVGPHHVAAL